MEISKIIEDDRMYNMHIKINKSKKGQIEIFIIVLASILRERAVLGNQVLDYISTIFPLVLTPYAG
ncbi:hypothetical protein ASZ90_019424 [hydrocarbon metagenome]|uniref:Uncharacterized protein n=1 Tax=hydrocarbon metagenome TaxID=938273 RepID=A0A0W8E394_9ZZZZ